MQARLASPRATGVPVQWQLGQPWARELATRPGAHVVSEPGEITTHDRAAHATGALVEEPPCRRSPS